MKIWLSKNVQPTEKCIWCKTLEDAINEIEYFVTLYIQNRARPLDLKSDREYLAEGIETIYCDIDSPIVQFMKEKQYDKSFNTKFIYIE